MNNALVDTWVEAFYRLFFLSNFGIVFWMMYDVLEMEKTPNSGWLVAEMVVVWLLLNLLVVVYKSRRNLSQLRINLVTLLSGLSLRPIWSRLQVPSFRGLVKMLVAGPLLVAWSSLVFRYTDLVVPLAAQLPDSWQTSDLIMSGLTVLAWIGFCAVMLSVSLILYQWDSFVGLSIDTFIRPNLPITLGAPDHELTFFESIAEEWQEIRRAGVFLGIFCFATFDVYGHVMPAVQTFAQIISGTKTDSWQAIYSFFASFILEFVILGYLPSRPSMREVPKAKPATTLQEKS